MKNIVVGLGELRANLISSWTVIVGHPAFCIASSVSSFDLEQDQRQANRLCVLKPKSSPFAHFNGLK